MAWNSPGEVGWLAAVSFPPRGITRTSYHAWLGPHVYTERTSLVKLFPWPQLHFKDSDCS